MWPYTRVFNLLEAVVPEYDGAGVVREPSGSTLTGIVPTNTYLCRDGKYVIIGGNGDSIFRRPCAQPGVQIWRRMPGWPIMLGASPRRKSMRPSLPGRRRWMP